MSMVKRLVAVAAVVMLVVVAGGRRTPAPPFGLASGHILRTASTAHLAVIVMENKESTQVVGNPNAPYINGTLIPRWRVMGRDPPELPKAAHFREPSSPR
jgi:hypothetical protein